MMTMKNNNVTSPPRERVSVAISGIDRSTPDDIVLDGKCETLHNMRYSAEAWRSVHPYKPIKEGISFPFNVSIVYHHPVAGEDKYIVEAKNVSLDKMTFIYSLYDINSKEHTNIVTLNERPKISHFGNVLILTANSGVFYYLYKDGKYIHYSKPAPPSFTLTTEESGQKKLPDFVQLSATIPPFSDKSNKQYVGLSKDKWYSGEALDEIIKTLKAWYTLNSTSITIHCLWLVSDATNGNSLLPSTYQDMFGDPTPPYHGEFALFAAYRSTNGAIVSQSPLHICCSNDSLSGKRVVMDCFFKEGSVGNYADFIATPPVKSAATTYIGIIADIDSARGTITDADIREHCPISYVNTRVDIALNRPNTSVIGSVALYATRLNPIFDSSFYLQDIGSVEPRRIWADNKLPEQPFYCLWEQMLDIDDEGDYVDQFTVNIDARMLERNIHNATYVPPISHTLMPATSLDFNNSLHIGDVTEVLSVSPLLSTPVQPVSIGKTTQAAVAVRRDNSTYYVLGDSYSALLNPTFLPPFNTIISYPDANAISFYLCSNGDVFKYRLNSAMANNFAYLCAPPTDEQKYGELSIEDVTNTAFPSLRNTIARDNMLFVSEPNDCTTFSFSRAYRIGSNSNRIIALQSAAIEMPEMKVGEMPLYAFTEEGIYALIAGSDTLYARISPVNYDKIINPNTLAINGAIVYITEKGVHLLTSQGTQVISTPIHDKANRPPLDFLRTCTMIYPKEHTEIILHNEDDDRGVAYVYNINTGYWSTRDLKGRKLNTDELYNNNTLYDLANEDESKALACSIETRPIKLGDVEFKRIESIVPRIATNSDVTMLQMSLSGSTDGTEYMPMRSVDIEFDANRVNPLLLRRTPFSARYFKFSFHFKPESNQTFNPSISHIDIEWYKKLRHRMR